MKRLGIFIALLAGLIFVMQPLTAQDEKKNEEKKKIGTPAKDKKAIEKMPAFGSKIVTRIMSANGASNREFTIESKEIDPKKVHELGVWQAEQQKALANAQQGIARARDADERLSATQDYQRALANFNIELAIRQIVTYSPRPYEVRATEDAKVRTQFLPVMFDDRGFVKKLTEKEKKELRGNTQLPGYPSDFDAIKPGQLVEIYMVKKAPPPPKDKDALKKKKKTDDDPPPPAITAREFVLIVILQEGK